jgi:anti-sigma factor RsiW
MNRESQIKLAAYLDGELPPAESRQVETWVASDPAAEVLLAELRLTRDAMRGNELEVKLPESREFYWSKIQQAIEKQSANAGELAARPEPMAWFYGLRRLLLPLSGFALVMLLAVGSINLLVGEAVMEPAEIENVSEDTLAFSFRNQSEKMTVVWVMNRDTESDDTMDDDTVVD